MGLMDATQGDRPAAFEILSSDGPTVLGPLLEAIRREEDALLESMQTTVDALRGPSPASASGLAEAQIVLDGRLEALRRNSGPEPQLSEGDRRALLVALDTRRQLVFRQRAIEEWVSEWQLTERGDDLR